MVLQDLQKCRDRPLYWVRNPGQTKSCLRTRKHGMVEEEIMITK